MKTTSTYRETPDTFLFQGVELRILLSAHDTGGQFTLIDGIMPPGGDGGLHVHDREDESMTLIEGTLDVTIGEESFRLHSGQSYFAPRGIPHRLHNPGRTPARSLLVTTPGGFDSFIAAAGVPLRDGVPVSTSAPPTPEQLVTLLKLAADYGIRMLEPPIHAVA